jgi:hypothetical protein
VLCFIVPVATESHLFDMLFLLLAVNTLGQVSGPTESSVLPLVASEEELATAASLINLSSAAGSAFGMALLAPVLVRAVGVELVLYLAGALLLLAASRVFDLPVEGKRAKLEYSPPHVRARSAAQWLVGHPAVATMILVSVLSGTANVVMQTLAPRYVQSALHVDCHRTGISAFADEDTGRTPGGAPRVLVYVLGPSLVGHGRQCGRGH